MGHAGLVTVEHHAGGALDVVGQRLRAQVLQLLVGDRRDRTGNLADGLVQLAGGDHHGFQVGGGVRVRLWRRVLSPGRRTGHQAETATEADGAGELAKTRMR